jgi:tetratricopeptide (TPR) repeat protein
MHAPISTSHRSLPTSLGLGWLLVLSLLLGCSSGKKLTREEKLASRREFGEYYLQSGDWDRAEDQVLRGLEIDRNDEELRRMLGQIKLKRGDTESLMKARIVFEGFDTRKDPQAAVGLGESLERLGVVHRYTARSVEQGERIAPKNDAAAEVERLNKEARKLWNQAIRSFEHALAINPEDLGALNGMQRTYALLGDFENAAMYSNRVIAMAEGELAALEETLTRPKGQPDAARDERLRMVARRTRKLLLDTYWLAYTIEVERRSPDIALQHLNRVIELTPGDEVAYSRRAQLNFELGRYQAAIDDATEFVKRSDKPYEDPDIRKAWELRYTAEQALK